ncbi:vWA domain-containing protein [Sinomonas halotolerans]|uniref:VWA domain-containing protein n=1 Tax=Sinomonas halotolerans TaxID=1644133 RepID=A0ABU9WZP2_9MICC
MDLIQPWVLVPGALAAAAVLGLALHRARRAHDDAAPVAHGERLASLPSYQRLVRRERAWLAVVVLAALTVAGALLAAAARPALTSAQRPEQRSRDIMLCLDASGSMSRADAAIVDVFASMVRDFRGERIGMTVFDASGIQVFPLTDDYAYIEEQLARAEEAFDRRGGDPAFFEGTQAGHGTSLIGDGLAACVQDFPRLDTEQRSRSIVFSTDNYLAGTPVFTLPEAADLAASKGVRVYALNPADFGSPSAEDEALELRRAAESTGGQYFPLRSPRAARTIIGEIQATESAATKGPARGLVADRPDLPLGIALAAGAVLAVGLARIRS